MIACIIAALLPKLQNIPEYEITVKQYANLTERETPALAISNKEEDSRIYHEFTDTGILAGGI